MISSSRLFLFLLIAPQICCIIMLCSVGKNRALRGLFSDLLFCEISLHIPHLSVI